MNKYLNNNSPVIFLKDKIDKNLLKQQGFDTDTIWYHVSNQEFDKFDLNQSIDGCIWLTKDYNSILNGETGASINSKEIKIHKFYIKTNKLGGWEEEDKYFTEELKQQGYEGVLLDNDLKLFNPDNTFKIKTDFKNKSIREEFNSNTVFYHGNENKKHSFSEIMPSFFTSDKEYAKGYGDYVYSYNIEINNPFDTATNEEDRKYYNEIFLNHELGKEAKEINKNEHISENDADNFWAFIAVEVQLDKTINYDSIVVNESAGHSEEYKTHLSIIPLNTNQIKAIQKINKKNKLR
jgi:hypothetical protein